MKKSTFAKDLVAFLVIIDNHLEPLTDKLIQALGDEGNDIGDADNAMQLMMNQITERHNSYKATEFRHHLAILTKISVDKIKHYMMYLELVSTKKEYKPAYDLLKAQYKNP